ncbi:MAG: PEP-CTERM sorting domain-containing protein [Planctomycetaceae bacterium]|nr:PEP-CTERM sorting domain-containing protein [Planctomycetaceae bacterium]
MSSARRGIFTIGIAVVVLLATAGTSQAALIAISNGDFNTSLQTYTNANGADLGGGWTRLAGTGTAVYAGIDTINTGLYSVMGSASGNKLIMQYQASSNAAKKSYVKSPMLGNAAGTTELLIQANTTYTITVAVGNMTGTGFTGTLGSDNMTRNGIELLLDGSARAIRRIDGFSVPDAAAAAKTPDNGGTDGTWQDYTLTFTTDALGNVLSSNGSAGFTGYSLPAFVGENILGKAMRIEFRTEAFNLTKQNVEFDNVRIDVASTIVPEPATMSLLVLGGVAALLRKRRN